MIYSLPDPVPVLSVQHDMRHGKVSSDPPPLPPDVPGHLLVEPPEQLLVVLLPLHQLTPDLVTASQQSGPLLYTWPFIVHL